MAYRNYGPEVGFIVDQNGHGDFTTIAAALTAASSGTTIFINPGVYTENLTGKAGVNLAAFVCDAYNPNVTIDGKISFSAAGDMSISGIRLETNGDFFLEITGTSASRVNINCCYLLCSDNSGWSISSTGGARLKIDDCRGDITTTGVAWFSQTGSSSLCEVLRTQLNNTGGANVLSTLSAGNFFTNAADTYLGVAASGSSFQSHTNAAFVMASGNVMTFTGGCTALLNGCEFYTSGSSCLSIGAGCSVDSQTPSTFVSNGGAVSGAGTYAYSIAVIGGSNAAMTATTLTTRVVQISRIGIQADGSVAWDLSAAGAITKPLQPAFLAYNSATDTNQTGNGATATVPFDTEVYDQASNFASNTFTAPVTGKYLLTTQVIFSNIATASGGNLELVTSNNTYPSGPENWAVSASGGFRTAQISVIADMDVMDTAFVRATLTGEAGNTVGYFGAGTPQTYFSGALIC